MMPEKRRRSSFWGPTQRKAMQVRQRYAPQPDAQPRTSGMTPDQIQKRTLPGSSPGVMGITGGGRAPSPSGLAPLPGAPFPGLQPPYGQPGVRQPTQPVVNPPEIHQQGSKKPPKKGGQNGQGGTGGGQSGHMNPTYNDYLDQMNQESGLSDEQVAWLKANILGRGPQHQSGREGQAYQRQLAQAIRAAGGVEQFMASIAQMPGVRRNQARAGEMPDSYAPGTWQGGPPPVGQQPYGQPGGRPPPAGQQPFGQPGVRPPPTAQVMPGAPTPMAAKPATAIQPPPPGPQVGEPDIKGNNVGQGGKGGKGGPAGMGPGGEAHHKKERDWFIGKNIPMTPQFEAEIRGIEDKFSAEMHSLGMDQRQIGVFVEQAKNQAMEALDAGRKDVDTGAAGAGMFNSGTRLSAQDDLSAGFGDEMRGIAERAAQQYADIATGRADARFARRSAIEEALMQRNRDALDDQSSPIYSGPKKKHKRNRSKSKGKKYA